MDRAQFSYRVRFNWGYHDARFDVAHKLLNRERIPAGKVATDGNRPLPWWDGAYCEGYHRGMESDLNNPVHALSSWAWEDYSKAQA